MMMMIRNFNFYNSSHRLKLNSNRKKRSDDDGTISPSKITTNHSTQIRQRPE